MASSTAENSASPQAGWRFKLGLTIFVIGFASPLLIPLVTASNLSTQWKTIFSGALAVGIPEVFSIVAIAIMGKPGFNLIKQRFFGFIRKYGPPEKVGPMRYRVGIVMFFLPLLFGWVVPYAQNILPGYASHRFVFAIIGDAMFISSLFVLGGEFWDKVRALFIHSARVVIPSKEQPS